MRLSGLIALALSFVGSTLPAQIIAIDAGLSARHQTIDGFGTCLSGTEGQQTWWRNLFFDDLRCSMLRMDLTPVFKSPYSDFTYILPGFIIIRHCPGRRQIMSARTLARRIIRAFSPGATPQLL